GQLGYITVHPAGEAGLVARVPGSLWCGAGVWSSSLSTTDADFVWVNIAVNVHQRDVLDPTSVFGTLNETIPNQSTSCGQITQSHFTSRPACISQPVTQGAPVYVTSQVTQTDGSFPYDNTGATVQ